MEARAVVTTSAAAWRESEPRPAAGGGAHLRLGAGRAQTWEGWGGCFNELGWIALSALPAARRDAVLRALFDPRDGCRFGLCRVPVGASDYAAEWYSHNETPGDLAMRHFSIARDREHLLPYLRAAQALRPDLRLFASPWSPPAWMKFPRAYNHGTLVWEPANLRAYALYLALFVEAYAAEGLPVVQVHPQNEPAADQKFPSCLWSGAQLRDFIRDHLGPVFTERGLDTEIWLGTLNMDDYDGVVNTVLSDERAHALVAGVGLQWWGGRMAQRVRAAWPEKRILQTENECGDGRNTWAYAHHVFGLVQHYLANGAVGYAYWNMVLQPGGASTWGWKQNAMITADPASGDVTFNPEFYVMKHFSRFIGPGAVRVEVSGPLSANAVAFEHAGGRRVAVVANPLATGRPCVVADGDAAWSVDLPAQSFLTLEWGG